MMAAPFLVKDLFRKSELHTDNYKMLVESYTFSNFVESFQPKIQELPPLLVRTHRFCRVAIVNT